MNAVGKVANHIKDSHKECISERFFMANFHVEISYILELKLM